MSRGRAAVVTGAGRGLGQAIADRLAADGYAVVYADLDLAAARSAAGSSLAVELDVRELTSVEACLAAAVEAHGGVDVWVNNAALTIARTFFEIDPAEWDDVIAINLRGVYVGCRVAGLRHAGARRGRIVNLTSIAGQQGASTTASTTPPRRPGSSSITRFAPSELAAPWRHRERGRAGGDRGPERRRGPRGDQSRRWRRRSRSAGSAAPRRSRRLAAYLASDDAGFVTGATYDVNGGMLMR